jgi:hypothetical protein
MWCRYNERNVQLQHLPATNTEKQNTHKYNEPRQSYIIFEKCYNTLKHRFIRCIAFSFRQQADDMLQEIHINRLEKNARKTGTIQ